MGLGRIGRNSFRKRQDSQNSYGLGRIHWNFYGLGRIGQISFGKQVALFRIRAGVGFKMIPHTPPDR